MGTGVEATERGTTLVVKDGRLEFDFGRPVRVVEGQFIHVGCHRLTREAWELLKRLVDKKVVESGAKEQS